MSRLLQWSGRKGKTRVLIDHSYSILLIRIVFFRQETWHSVNMSHLCTFHRIEYLIPPLRPANDTSWELTLYSRKLAQCIYSLEYFLLLLQQKCCHKLTIMTKVAYDNWEPVFVDTHFFLDELAHGLDAKPWLDFQICLSYTLFLPFTAEQENYITIKPAQTVDRYHVVIKVQIYDIFIDYTECFVDLGYVSTFFSIKHILLAQHISKWDRAQVMTTII